MPPVAVPAAPVRQLRGLWVDAFGPGLKTPREIDRLVEDAKAMGVNALFAQVGRRGDCYCLKAAMPFVADPEVPAGFDPLQYLLERAHPAGLQVHAWIITTSVRNLVTPEPTDPEHPFNRHGPSATGRDFWLTVREDGEAQAGKDYVLDPGHPDAAEYIAAMYASVVAAYPVDGVQLDRVRYPDDPSNLPVWGYNPTALERFSLETGRTDRPAPTDAQWSRWRREQVTNLVRRVYLAVKAARPEAWVSAATITYGAGPATLDEFVRTRTYTQVLQDWPAWMSEGILDMNIPMNYKRDAVPEQARAFDRWNRFALLHRGGGAVASGAAIYLNAQEASLAQLRRSLQPGFDGWVGYSYRTPDGATYAGSRNPAEALAELQDRLAGPGGPFAGPATWGPAPTDRLSGVAGRLVRRGEGVAAADLELVSGEAVVGRARTDGGGFYGFVNAPGGELTVRLAGPFGPTATVAAQAGRVTEAPLLELP